uniref:Uncharacterized protein n=1 Tax=Anguilla anguilla TaxID=7936 RepID=A0A0E9TE88_ANGAN
MVISHLLLNSANWDPQLRDTVNLRNRKIGTDCTF